MNRESRYLEYAKRIHEGQAKEPAPSIKDKLSQMKEKSKKVNKKPEKDGKGDS